MNAYVGAGYGVTFAALALYGWWVVRRERVLRSALPRRGEASRS